MITSQVPSYQEFLQAVFSLDRQAILEYYSRYYPEHYPVISAIPERRFVLAVRVVRAGLPEMGMTKRMKSMMAFAMLQDMLM